MDNKSSLNRPNSWTTSEMLHGDLLASKELIYDKCGFVCSQPYEEAQNAEYGTYVFTINALSIRFRVAKTTQPRLDNLLPSGSGVRKDRHNLMTFQIQQMCMSLVRVQAATLVNLYFQSMYCYSEISYRIKAKVANGPYVYIRLGISQQLSRL